MVLRWSVCDLSLRSGAVSHPLSPTCLAPRRGLLPVGDRLWLVQDFWSTRMWELGQPPGLSPEVPRCWAGLYPCASAMKVFQFPKWSSGGNTGAMR